MSLEHCDRRIIGAVRLVDATTQLPIREPLHIEAPRAQFWRNRSGYYVIVQAPGFAAYTRSFPDAVAIAQRDLELTIADPAGQYLTQRQSIPIPPTDRFQPTDVRLFLAPTAKPATGWALIRATITRQGTTQGLAGAFVRVVRSSDAQVLGTGLSDGRGEALVAVAQGIPAITWREIAGRLVMTSEIAVSVQAFFDATASPIPNPVELERTLASLSTASTNLTIAASRSHIAQLAIAVP